MHILVMRLQLSSPGLEAGGRCQDLPSRMTYRQQECLLVANAASRLGAVAMLQMPASRRSVSTGVDLSCPVTTLRAFFGNAPAARCGKGRPWVATPEPDRLGG